ncbi:hypothetical protein ACFZCU_19210 [Streptomyces canus]|uniref:hypothetical protein n=1 Tax=Streptomyces canus TaxID=58343 RepID=UPI0036EC6867
MPTAQEALLRRRPAIGCAGREAVRAYWARQFAVRHPLVRLEGPGSDGSPGRW